MDPSSWKINESLPSTPSSIDPSIHCSVVDPFFQFAREGKHLISPDRQMNVYLFFFWSFNSEERKLPFTPQVEGVIEPNHLTTTTTTTHSAPDQIRSRVKTQCHGPLVENNTRIPGTQDNHVFHQIFDDFIFLFRNSSLDCFE